MFIDKNHNYVVFSQNGKFLGAFDDMKKAYQFADDYLKKNKIFTAVIDNSARLFK